MVMVISMSRFLRHLIFLLTAANLQQLVSNASFECLLFNVISQFASNTGQPKLFFPDLPIHWAPLELLGSAEGRILFPVISTLISLHSTGRALPRASSQFLWLLPYSCLSLFCLPLQQGTKPYFTQSLFPSSWKNRSINPSLNPHISKSFPDPNLFFPFRSSFTDNLSSGYHQILPHLSDITVQDQTKQASDK